MNTTTTTQAEMKRDADEIRYDIATAIEDIALSLREADRCSNPEMLMELLSDVIEGARDARCLARELAKELSR